MALGTPVAGAAAYSASGGTTVSPAYPAGILATDVVLIFTGQKPSTANGGTVTTPAGWTLVDQLTAAGGYGTTLGADTGNTNLRVYKWDAPVAGQTGTRALTLTQNNVSWAFMVRVPTGGGAITHGSATGQRTTTPTSPMAIALTNNATNPTAFQSGDLAIWAMCVPTDVTTPAQFSAESVTATGATFATAVEINEPDSTTGNDIGGYSARATVTAGSSTTAPTVTATLAGTLTNVRGPVVLVRVREAVVTALTLDAQPTSFAITGSPTTFVSSRHLVASPATYNLTGQAATTAVQRVLVASAGSLSITGSPATLAANKALVANSGSYSVTGVDVTFIVTTAMGIDLQPASFTITGSPATLARSRQFVASSATYTYTGSNAALSTGLTFLAGSGSYSSAEYVNSGYVDPGYVGNDNPPASLVVARKLNIESGSFTLTGSDVTFVKQNILSANAGSYVISFPTPSQTYVLKYWTGSLWQILYKDPIVYP